MRRGGQHQTRRDRRQGQPHQHLAARDWRSRSLGRRSPVDPPAGPGTQRDQYQQQDIARRPAPPLRLEWQQGLDQQRVGDQAGETAQVRSGVKRPGRPGTGLGRKPALHKRRLGRNQEEHRTDANRQQRRDPQRLHPGAWGRQIGQGDRESKRGQREQEQMHLRLPPQRQPRETVGIEIPRQQQRLVDQHGAVPHVGRAAQARQGHPRDQRLDQEQQERSGENRRHEQGARRGGCRAAHRADQAARVMR